MGVSISDRRKIQCYVRYTIHTVALKRVHDSSDIDVIILTVWVQGYIQWIESCVLFLEIEENKCVITASKSTVISIHCSALRRSGKTI